MHTTNTLIKLHGWAGWFKSSMDALVRKYVFWYYFICTSNKLWALINRDQYITIFISYPISIRDTHISLRAESPRLDIGRNLIWGMIIKLPYHNQFIIHFFLTYLPIWYRMWSQRQDRRVLRIVWYRIFCPGKKKRRKKNVSPTWSGDMFLFFVFFCPSKKAVSHTGPIITTFALIESHVSITYAKWTYFLVNVWMDHTFTRKYVHFAYVILTWLSSTYHSFEAQKGVIMVTWVIRLLCPGKKTNKKKTKKTTISRNVGDTAFLPGQNEKQ